MIVLGLTWNKHKARFSWDHHQQTPWKKIGFGELVLQVKNLEEHFKELHDKILNPPATHGPQPPPFQNIMGGFSDFSRDPEKWKPPYRGTP